MFPLEPGGVVICYTTGPAREMQGFSFSFLFFFGVVTSDTHTPPPPAPGLSSSLSHPQQGDKSGDRGGLWHPRE